jgi:hypothetical protein
MERISTDDGCFIPQVHSEFMDIFCEAIAETLAPHHSIDHTIHLEPGIKLLYGQIYNLSKFQQNTQQAYIETNPANELILWSSSQVEALIQFLKNTDARLWHSVDDRALTSATIVN